MDTDDDHMLRPITLLLPILVFMAGFALLDPIGDRPTAVAGASPVAPTPAPTSDAEPSADSGTATATATATDGIWLVSSPGLDAGWAVLYGDSQYLDPGCRHQLEADGAEFEIIEWERIAVTGDLTERLTCDEVAGLYFAVPPTSAGDAEHTPLQCDLDDAHAGDDGPTAAGPDVVEPGASDGMGSGTTTPVGFARGINFAGDLEVTPRRSWGTPIDPNWFGLVAEQGFDHVRVPIRWSAYTGAAPDHTIDAGFFAEVDQLVDLATANDLGIVLDVHFFEELDEDPWAERAHFLAIWDQIARRYADTSDRVAFELLNEPVGVFVDEPGVWNDLAADAVEVIRRTNPDRTVIIGPVSWNHASRLDDLVLPDDANLMATIHTYDPSPFTHQGAVWTDPVPPTGVVWDASERTLDFNWVDRSWGIDQRPVSSGIEVDFSETFTAFGAGDGSGRPADRLELRLDRPAELVVLCNLESGVIEVPIDIDGAGMGRADVGSCGAIESIALQHIGSGPATVVVSRIGLCDADTCEELIVTNAEALDQLIGGAAEWARAQGVPLYIGEFGVHDPADDPTDPASVEAWTRAVRTSAERHGAGWAAFDMSGGFAAYDTTTGTWRPEIIRALFD